MAKTASPQGPQFNYTKVANLALKASATGKIYSQDFLKSIEEQRLKIHSILNETKNSSIELGKSLLHLEQLFLSRVENGDETILKRQFHDFCEVEFNLKATRVRDHISVARCQIVHHLNTDFSSLVELARLDENELEKLLKTVDVKKLEAMTYRQMKEFVSKININKRKSLSPVSKKLSQKKFSEALRAIKKSFSMVRKKTDVSGIDAKQKKFLEDLAKWCQSTLKKYKPKKAKVKPSKKKGGTK